MPLPTTTIKQTPRSTEESLLLRGIKHMESAEKIVARGSGPQPSAVKTKSFAWQLRKPGPDPSFYFLIMAIKMSIMFKNII
jgi:hypothetical protein